MEEKYQCHICMEVANKPIVTPCGHLFCWACIYHWLRSNQEYLTCPLCKSGLELSSVRPILTQNQPPEVDQGGVPPRPRPHRKIKQHNNIKQIPKTILAMGLNVQRGVMLAGYGIFPATFNSLNHNFQAPTSGEDQLNNSSSEHKLYGILKNATWLVGLLCFLIIIFY